MKKLIIILFFTLLPVWSFSQQVLLYENNTDKSDSALCADEGHLIYSIPMYQYSVCFNDTIEVYEDNDSAYAVIPRMQPYGRVRLCLRCGEVWGIEYDTIVVHKSE